MPLPRSDTWTTKPGDWDPLHARDLYLGESEHGIPLLDSPVLPAELPSRFVPWPDRKHLPRGAGLHFFVDDYRFGPLWKCPDRYATVFDEVPVVLSPDFSLYPEWPRAMQVWNVYRSRWMARKLTLFCTAVVPAVTWADRASFAFSFAGIPRHSPVAVGSAGCSRAATAYAEGYREMVASLSPSLVFVVGPDLPSEIRDLAPVAAYPSEALRRVRGTDGR